MGQQAAAAAVHRRGPYSQPMHGPGWILVPWTVFALAAGIKAWRLWSQLRLQSPWRQLSTDQCRQLLERSWQRASVPQD